MFEKRTAVVELLRNLRVFWRVEAGVRREDNIAARVEGGYNHGDGRRGATQQAKRIKQLQDTLSKKNQRLQRLRKPLAEKDRELEELRPQALGEEARVKSFPYSL